MEALDGRGVPVDKHAAYYSDYSNVRAAKRRMRAIRAEIERHSVARKEEAKRTAQSERAQHQRVLGVAPPTLPTIPEVPEAARRLHEALIKCGVQAGKHGIG